MSMLVESQEPTGIPQTTNKLVRPLVKWVGGKRQLMDTIKRHVPSHIGRYYEPFFGGGAVLFGLQPPCATINDTNEELINLYKVVKENPKELIADLRRHKNEEEYFYEVRSLDRDLDKWSNLTEVQRASRLIFLNKTCFNGLYRVNNSGEFNAPFGRYKNPRIVDQVTINAVSRFLKANDVLLLNGDFQSAVTDASSGDFVYMDPPYDPVSSSASFTGYAKGGFDQDEQIRVRDTSLKLIEKGVNVLISNSSTDFIHKIYDLTCFKVVKVKARRAVNSNGGERGEVDEVLISNR